MATAAMTKDLLEKAAAPKAFSEKAAAATSSAGEEATWTPDERSMDAGLRWVAIHGPGGQGARAALAARDRSSIRPLLYKTHDWSYIRPKTAHRVPFI